MGWKADLKKLDPERILCRKLDAEIYNGDYKIPIRLYFASEEEMKKAGAAGDGPPAPALLFFHGGGWVYDGAGYGRIPCEAGLYVSVYCRRRDLRYDKCHAGRADELGLLLPVSAIGILWDRFTGWRGWSVDFLLPLASLIVLGSMPVIIRVQHLEKQEYLFYLVQCCGFGLIPIILLLTGVVQIPYPSVLCAGISILVLAGLFLFENRDTVRELNKKFRM